jgi:hypothetical protein
MGCIFILGNENNLRIIYNMEKIQENLDNIEKYLMVANLEKTKMENTKNNGVKFRGCIQNITKECLAAKKRSLEVVRVVAKEQEAGAKKPPVKKPWDVLKPVPKRVAKPTGVSAPSEDTLISSSDMVKPVLPAPVVKPVGQSQKRPVGRPPIRNTLKPFVPPKINM